MCSSSLFLSFSVDTSVFFLSISVLTTLVLTRAEWKELATETNKSAIIDQVAEESHVIDWSGANILDRESHQKKRQRGEFIHIGKEVNCMNRDGGAYNLLMTYDSILVTCSSAVSRDHMA